MSKIFYTDNGSTAVEAAIKMAFQYWYNQGLSRTKVICFRNSYHGDTFGAMSVAGKNDFNQPFWKHLFDVETIDIPLKGREDASIQQLKEILKKNETACFIYEPLILGSGGMVIYSPEGLNVLIQICREHQAITIADEVMTGFGRTSSLFASEQMQEKPDIICLSKGITGGFLPLGVTACKEFIYQAFLGEDLRKAFLHGHSYTANPLACSSALASLDLLLEDACTEQRKKIQESHQAFVAKWKNHPKLKRCESLGTILALEYRTESSSYFQSIRDTLYDYFLSQGILLRPLGNVLYVLPPYCITEDELALIYKHIAFTLEGELSKNAGRHKNHSLCA
jgi:adenosylmethionine-8-amino-7-oxononanoate aminotransferase